MAVTAVIPQLRTTNLDESIDFYVSKLGFELQFRYSDFYAGVSIGGQTIHLKLVDEPDPSIGFVAGGGHLHLFFEVDDAAAEAERLGGCGVALRQALTETPWGTREFYVADDQGHVLCFAESV